MDKKECGYYAVWAETESFDEVLVSPVMVVDHLPANVMRALRKVRAISQAQDGGTS